MESKVFLKNLAELTDSRGGQCFFCKDKKAETRHITIQARDGQSVIGFDICRPCLIGVTGSLTDCLISFKRGAAL